MDQNKIEPYWRIAQCLAEMMVEEAMEYSCFRGNDRRFYLYSYSIVSFNWDPIMLWLSYNAHEKINQEKHRINGRYLRLYDDGGDGIGLQRIESEDDRYHDDLLAFMMSEPICRRVNGKRFDDGNSHYFRVGKFLFPHGGIGWRVCPRCGKLFTGFGPKLGDVNSSVAFGPDLLPELNQAWKERTKDEETYWNNFHFGSMQCVFCGFMTHPSDAPLILQSALKSERHYVLEGIFREMGLLVGKARHTVFAGYTLPPDDVIYRSFFMSSKAGKSSTDRKPYCSLVAYDSNCSPSGIGPWLKNDEIIAYLKGPAGEDSAKKTIENLLQIYDKKYLRVTLMGFPDIVVKHPHLPLKEALKDLLYPKDCFPGGFPPNRDRSV
jgi:hypothetical protein